MTVLGNYFKRITSLIENVKVTGRLGEEMDVGRGMENACELILRCSEKGRQVIFIGNGGSAAVSSHLAVDFWKNGGIKAMAFNDSAQLTCLGNDFGYSHVFDKPIEMFAERCDLVIAISSSGRSENILLGIGAARTRGADVITLSGFKKDNPLRSLGDLNFYVPSMAYGPVEVIHHSICHGFLDAILVRQGKLSENHFQTD